MEERENETGNLYHNHTAVHRRESPRADRPHPCRNGSHLYRKVQEDLEEPREIMLLQTTGHIWTKEEVEAVTDLQREFNDYLDSFRSVISYAAQIYGFYHEITHLTETWESSPGNSGKVLPMPWQ